MTIQILSGHREYSMIASWIQKFLMPFLNLMSHLKCEHFIDTGTCFQLSLVKKQSITLKL